VASLYIIPPTRKGNVTAPTSAEWLGGKTTTQSSISRLSTTLSARTAVLHLIVMEMQKESSAPALVMLIQERR